MKTIKTIIEKIILNDTFIKLFVYLMAVIFVIFFSIEIN
jgi:hypothetical protein|tara:strand:+ start:1609 stop:1725 length:117 start_codon:yes stop_codon:yes gene_type:complete